MKISDVEAAIPELTMPDVIQKYIEMGLPDKAKELLRQFAMLVLEKQTALEGQMPQQGAPPTGQGAPPQAGQGAPPGPTPMGGVR